MYVAKYKYGLKPSKKHVSDLHYAASPILSLPPVFSLRQQCPPVYDQGQTGSCTGNSTAGVCQLKRTLEGKQNVVEPSRSFIYYNARAMEGTTGEDAGATIKDVCTGVIQNGFCSENEWPLDPATFLTTPPQKCFDDAKPEAGGQFLWVGEGLTGNALVKALKQAIASKDPIVAGITVYESFESAQVAKTGMVPVPHFWEQVLGGHAIAIIGWNDHIKCFECRNSWGPQWGDNGYFFLPYAFVGNPRLASEFGALQLIA